MADCLYLVTIVSNFASMGKPLKLHQVFLTRMGGAVFPLCITFAPVPIGAKRARAGQTQGRSEASPSSKRSISAAFSMVRPMSSRPFKRQ